MTDIIDINKQVAEKFGYKIAYEHGHFKPRTDHNDLALVKAKLIEDGYSIHINYHMSIHEWDCELMEYKHTSIAYGYGTTENEAVCLAALAAVEPK